MTKITIDTEFRDLIPPLRPEELEGLRASLKKEGCIDPLRVWVLDGELILLDGHHRYEICTAEGIDYQVEPVPIIDRDDALAWIKENQLSRRNLPDTRKQLSEVSEMEFIIDEEIRELGGFEQSESEYRNMKSLAQESGKIKPPIVIWKGQGIIVDGHHRYRLAQELGLDCPFEEMEFADKAEAMIYALRVNAAHKNSNKLQEAYNIGKRYLLMPKTPGSRSDLTSGQGASGQNVHRSSSQFIAEQLGIDEKTVRRHAEFAEAIDAIKAQGPGDLWKDILKGDLEVKREDLLKMKKALVKGDLFYLPPLTDEEIKAIQRNIKDEMDRHRKSGEPNVPVEMENSVSMKALQGAADVVFCPFCGKNHVGSDYVVITWKCCGHSIAEAVVQAHTNLEKFGEEAETRRLEREAKEKEAKLNKLVPVSEISEKLLIEAYNQKERWTKDTLGDILTKIDRLKLTTREAVK